MPQEVILGKVFVEVERVKQPVLVTCSTSHHRSAPRASDGRKHSQLSSNIQESFSTESGLSRRWRSKSSTSAMN